MKCFIIMPFQEEFDPVYTIIEKTLKDAGVSEPLRMDKVRAAGRITMDIQTELQTSQFCIADVTNVKPNVMWEVGYAAAMAKPTIIITQSLEELPFDIHDARKERYSLDHLDILGIVLTQAIHETVQRYELHRITAPPRAVRTIAITGTMIAEPGRVKRRLETLLPPYFSPDTTWYCGASGACDEMAAEFLLEAKQRVIGVGYQHLDVSSRMLRILEKYNAQFIDSSREQILRIPNAPSPRDVLFAQKSDFIILLWDGQSVGIQYLEKWLTEQSQSHLLAFV